MLPLALLLLAIAVLPLLRVTAHWWESNLHRFYVAAGLAALTMLYYLFWRGFPLCRRVAVAAPGAAGRRRTKSGAERRPAGPGAAGRIRPLHPGVVRPVYH